MKFKTLVLTMLVVAVLAMVACSPATEPEPTQEVVDTQVVQEQATPEESIESVTETAVIVEDEDDSVEIGSMI